jgi:hypothetical protein
MALPITMLSVALLLLLWGFLLRPLPPEPEKPPSRRKLIFWECGADSFGSSHFEVWIKFDGKRRKLARLYHGRSYTDPRGTWAIKPALDPKSNWKEQAKYYPYLLDLQKQERFNATLPEVIDYIRTVAGELLAERFAGIDRWDGLPEQDWQATKIYRDWHGRLRCPHSGRVIPEETEGLPA